MIKIKKVVAALIFLTPECAFGWTHGVSLQVPGGQSVINLPFGQNINLFKNAGSFCSSGCGTTAWPAYLNADGYIASADPPVDIGGNFTIPFGGSYYGHYTFSYSGCGSLGLGAPAIVYSGGAAIANLQPTSGASGSVAFNLGTFNQCNPTVEFAYGALIGAIADNGSGFVRLTGLVTGGPAFANLTSGTYRINNINGITPGTYALTRVSSGCAAGTNNCMDILALSYNSGTMSINSGSPGTASEIISSPIQGNIAFSHGHTSSWTMSNAVLCRTIDYSACTSGANWNPDFIASLQALKPGFLRFMDLSLTNGNNQTSFTYRAKTSNLAYGTTWRPDYWVGTITNGGSDAYTSSNPAASPSSGAYVDGEIVQGQIDVGNIGNSPTLALSGRSGGAKPILGNNNGAPNILVPGGTITAGDVINFTATASYISGGSVTHSYTITSADASGGLPTLAGHLASAILNDSAFYAANIAAYQIGATRLVALIYNTHGQGVSPSVATTFSSTITPSGGGGGETISIGTTPTVAQNATFGLASNELMTLTYNQILDGWVQVSGGLLTGTPIEADTDLCNKVGAGCWLNIPVFYTGTSVTSLVQTVAVNLNSNLNFGLEYANEVWNTADTQTAYAYSLGASLGFTGGGATANSTIQWDDFYGLRFKQFLDLAKTAWSGAGRTSGSLVGVLADAYVNLIGTVPSNSSVHRLNGADLTTANPTYAAIGGLGNTAGTNYTASPNRPVDDATVVSVAPYWQGTLIAEFASNWSGTTTKYATILQAGTDYASGNPTSMANSIAAIDADSRTGYSTYPAGYANIQTLISSYDSQRAGIGLAPLGRYDYEGGCQQGLGNSFSGTQDTGNDATGYAPLSAQFTSLGWNTSAYGASNDIVAQQVVTVFLAWKNSSVFQANVTNYLQQVVTAHPGRATMEAWYGYTGPSLWEFYPGNIYTTPQTSYNAFQVWP